MVSFGGKFLRKCGNFLTVGEPHNAWGVLRFIEPPMFMSFPPKRADISRVFPVVIIPHNDAPAAFALPTLRASDTGADHVERGPA